ncbi:hypothetical protein CVT26_006171 [Gymnopilus dilepis]|uniref:Uncharacterized protein n=1 Tax=Gymnopilus dilepis TaxID=231916 RepID=A0A409X6J3_9AGAR|nr:hypothetical protein CVT26_006171 [Gymnopilus dilepis]
MPQASALSLQDSSTLEPRLLHPNPLSVLFFQGPNIQKIRSGSSLRGFRFVVGWGRLRAGGVKEEGEGEDEDEDDCDDEEDEEEDDDDGGSCDGGDAGKGDVLSMRARLRARGAADEDASAGSGPRIRGYGWSAGHQDSLEQALYSRPMEGQMDQAGLRYRAPPGHLSGDS